MCHDEGHIFDLGKTPKFSVHGWKVVLEFKDLLMVVCSKGRANS